MNKRQVLMLVLPLLLLLGGCSPDGFVRRGVRYCIDGDGAVVIARRGIPYRGEVVIPDSITYNFKVYAVKGIGDEAFAHSRVTAVTLPATIEQVGVRAFAGCTQLRALHCQMSDPVEVDSTAFKELNPELITLYVPMGSGTAYENTPCWRQLHIDEEGTPAATTLPDGPDEPDEPSDSTAQP